MVNERANRMSWPSGRSRYNLAILAELRTFRPVPYELVLGGETWTTEAMLVAVGNGSSYGGGMRVCPDARLDDGLLDITVLGPISKPEFLRVFPTVYKGTHVRHPAVTVRRARQVTLTSPGVTAYADGERVSVLPVTCDAVPDGMRVFAPHGTAEDRPTGT
jgi:diacylglycerol kinase (ATP)